MGGQVFGTGLFLAPESGVERKRVFGVERWTTTVWTGFPFLSYLSVHCHCGLLSEEVLLLYIACCG